VVDKSKQGKRNRTAGHDFEREMAQKFRRWYPDARRGLQYQDGKHCPDIVGTDFWIECKHWKQISPWRAIEFWEKTSLTKPKDHDDYANLQPILVYRVSGSRAIRVVMGTGTWLEIATAKYTKLFCWGPIEILWEVFERAMDHWKGVQGEAGQSEKVPVA